MAANFLAMCPALPDASGQNLTFAVHHDFDGSDVIIINVDSADGFSFGSQHRLHAFFNVQENSCWLMNRAQLTSNPGQIAERKVVLRIRSGAGCSGPMRATALLEPELLLALIHILKPCCLVHD